MPRDQHKISGIVNQKLNNKSAVMDDPQCASYGMGLIHGFKEW